MKSASRHFLRLLQRGSDRGLSAELRWSQTPLLAKLPRPLRGNVSTARWMLAGGMLGANRAVAAVLEQRRVHAASGAGANPARQASRLATLRTCWITAVTLALTATSGAWGTH